VHIPSVVSQPSLSPMHCTANTKRTKDCFQAEKKKKKKKSLTFPGRQNHLSCHTSMSPSCPLRATRKYFCRKDPDL